MPSRTSWAEQLARLGHEIVAATELAPDVVETISLTVLDQIGIMVFAGTLPGPQPCIRVARGRRGHPEASAVGLGFMTTVADAGLVNATLAHACEFDDTGYGGSAHAGSICVPTALAVGQQRGASGRDVLKAVAAGYEVMYRLGRALTPGLTAHGLHPQSVLGPFGAATTASVLMGLTIDQTIHALTIAASHCSGTMEYARAGGEVKRYHAGMATHAGITSALLAEQGLTGPLSALDGPHGIARVLARLTQHDVTEEQLLTGNDWLAVERRILKLYPVVGTIATALQALDEIAGLRTITADEVRRIDVWMSEYATHHGSAIIQPTDALGAQFSLPYAAGLRISRGSTDVAHFFDITTWDDPEIQLLASRVHAHVDPSLTTANWDEYWGSRVEVALADGEVLRSAQPYRRGSHKNPASAEDVKHKFARLVDNRWSEADQIADLIVRLDDAPDISRLLTSLPVANPTSSKGHP